MGNFLNPENRLMARLSKMSDALILGVLWLICSLPLITLGASSTSFYYTYHKVVRQKRGYLVREFFSAFKTNFKQATIIWVIMLIFYVITGIDCYIMFQSLKEGGNSLIILFVVVILMLLVTMWGLCVFPYLARFYNTTKAIMKNSMIIMLLNLGWMIILFVLAVITALALILFAPAVIFMPAIYMWLANKILERVFRKYMRTEDLKTQLEFDELA